MDTGWFYVLTFLFMFEAEVNGTYVSMLYIVLYNQRGLFNEAF